MRGTVTGLTAVINGSDPFAVIKTPDIRTTPVGAADGKEEHIVSRIGK